jgi:hypothetical protein
MSIGRQGQAMLTCRGSDAFDMLGGMYPEQLLPLGRTGINFHELRPHLGRIQHLIDGIEPAMAFRMPPGRAMGQVYFVFNNTGEDLFSIHG